MTDKPTNKPEGKSSANDATPANAQRPVNRQPSPTSGARSVRPAGQRPAGQTPRPATAKPAAQPSAASKPETEKRPATGAKPTPSPSARSATGRQPERVRVRPVTPSAKPTTPSVKPKPIPARSVAEAKTAAAAPAAPAAKSSTAAIETKPTVAAAPAKPAAPAPEVKTPAAAPSRPAASKPAPTATAAPSRTATQLPGGSVMTTVTLPSSTKVKTDKPDAKKRSKLPLIATGIVGLLLVVIIVVCAVVLSSNKIYSGVYIDGVDFGGKTKEQARDIMLKQSHSTFATDSSGAIITGVTLSIDDEQLTLSTDEVKLSFVDETAIDRAYEIGRKGSIFNRLGDIIALQGTQQDIDANPTLYIDQAAIEEKVNTFVAERQVTRANDTFEVTPTSVVVWQGKDGVIYDTNGLIQAFNDAFTDIATGHQPQPKDFNKIVIPRIKVSLDDIAKDVYVEPVSAKVEKNTGKKLPDKSGIELDVTSGKKLLDDSQANPVTIPLTTVKAKVTLEELDERLFRDVLYVAKTDLHDFGANRTNNVRLAAEYTNGVILNPGDVYSYNQSVGERTTSRGFKDAGVYKAGKLIDDVGGGICQVATTIYQAALYTNMEIVERDNHVFAVVYSKLSLDATVYWGSLDFKFRNTSDYPVKLLTSLKNGQVICTVMGTKIDDTYVKMESIKLSTTPFKTVTTVNPAMAPGTSKLADPGHTGYTSEAYRCVYDGNDKLISRTKMSYDVYKKSDRTTEVGPTAAAPPASAAPATEAPAP